MTLNVPHSNKFKIFEDTYIAHRGLFQPQNAIPENSMPAFRAAISAGYGIELDVQLTSDDRLVVFHDASLKRMCGVDILLRKCTYEQLQGYPLANSSETIPLFEDVLKDIDGKVPLIVEIKSEGNWRQTTRQTAKLLDYYNGAFCIESFHPFVLQWFRKNRPNVIRGQLSTNYFKDNIRRTFLEKFLLTNLMLNFISRPDFIAYNHRWKKQLAFRICLKFFKIEAVAWTIKSQKELEDARDSFRIFIFDSFIPDEDK